MTNLIFSSNSFWLLPALVSSIFLTLRELIKLAVDYIKSKIGETEAPSACTATPPLL